MRTILRIDASSRLQGSHSRELADYWVEIWSQHHPQDSIIVRDLVETSLPHLSQTAIAGFYTPSEQQTPAMKADS